MAKQNSKQIALKIKKMTEQAAEKAAFQTLSALKKKEFRFINKTRPKPADFKKINFKYAKKSRDITRQQAKLYSSLFREQQVGGKAKTVFAQIQRLEKEKYKILLKRRKQTGDRASGKKAEQYDKRVKNIEKEITALHKSLIKLETRTKKQDIALEGKREKLLKKRTAEVKKAAENYRASWKRSAAGQPPVTYGNRLNRMVRFNYDKAKKRIAWFLEWKAGKNNRTKGQPPRPAGMSPAEWLDEKAGHPFISVFKKQAVEIFREKLKNVMKSIGHFKRSGGKWK